MTRNNEVLAMLIIAVILCGWAWHIGDDISVAITAVAIGILVFVWIYA